MNHATSIAVLAIDDDEEDLVILRHHLRRMAGVEVEVRTFQDPAAGLRESLQWRPDVILLDYMLGTQTGIDLFEKLEEAGIDVPVILITDHGDEETAAEALHAGVSDYMPKEATSPKSLRRAILNSIERSVLRRAIRQHSERLELTVERLRSRNEEIQSFYHSLSHELKTPLTAVREFLSIVLEGLQGPLADGQRESLEIAKSACDQMTACINDIIDTARIETGKLSLELRETAVQPVLRQAVAHCSRLAVDKGVALRLTATEGLPKLYIDEQRILQVLTNLIGNAIKFTDSGGLVEVSAHQVGAEPDHVLVTITDNGCGIELGEHENIFERLYQSRDEDAALLGGLGLGLHLCRELVRAHDGWIDLQSNPGAGSVFTCHFPTRLSNRKSKAPQ